MDNLRLILLVIGIAAIVVIYSWDVIRQRKKQRQQTIHQKDPGLGLPELKISAKPDLEEDYSTALSELSNHISDINNHTVEGKTGNGDVAMDDEGGGLDLFPKGPETQQRQDVANNPESNVEADATNNIVMLHITALPTKLFAGEALFEAAGLVGLVYGDMNIYHHYGVGDMRSEKALFSLSNMYEPGYFSLDEIEKETIKGLTLFLCLPTAVDAQIVFELMLNTTQRLARILDGEVRGPTHKLLNDEDIASLRNKITEFLSHQDNS